MSKLLIHKGTVLNRLRRIGKRGATATVILSTAVWINMALQPCLMAAEPLASVAVLTPVNELMS